MIDFCTLPQKAEPLKSGKIWPILSRKLLPQILFGPPTMVPPWQPRWLGFIHLAIFVPCRSSMQYRPMKWQPITVETTCLWTGDDELTIAFWHLSIYILQDEKFLKESWYSMDFWGVLGGKKIIELSGYYVLASQVDTPLARPSCLAVDLARNEIWLADFENNQLACYFSSL